MIVFTLAFPERLGKYGATDFVRERLGMEVDLNSRNLCQKIGEYEVTVMDSRTVPAAVELGILTGITGEDWFYDYKLGKPDTRLRIVEKLPFGYSSVVAFKNPENSNIIKRVASPYENISIDYIRKNNLEAEFFPIRGKTEGWVKTMTRLADLGIDNQNSGKTIADTGLIIVDKIMDSQAVIISKEYDIEVARKIWRLT